MMLPEDWDFCRVPNCRNREVISLLRHWGQVRDRLQRLKTNPTRMLALRSLLWQHSIGSRVSGIPDEAVIDELIQLLISGRVHVHLGSSVRVLAGGSGGSQGPGSGAAAEEEPAAAPFPLAPRTRASQPAASPAQPMDEPVFSPDLDDNAQAAVLVASAAGGKPFCPE